MCAFSGTIPPECDRWMDGRICHNNIMLCMHSHADVQQLTSKGTRLGCCHPDLLGQPVRYVIVSLQKRYVLLSMFDSSPLHYVFNTDYVPVPSIWALIKRWCASDVCLSRTYGLSREQGGLGRLNWHRGSPRHKWLGHHFQGQKVKGQRAGAGAYCSSLPHSLLHQNVGIVERVHIQF